MRNLRMSILYGKHPGQVNFQLTVPEVQCALGQRHTERKGFHRRSHPRHLREGQGAAAWVALSEVRPSFAS